MNELGYRRQDYLKRIFIFQILAIILSCTSSFAGLHALGGLGKVFLFIALIYLIVAILLLTTIIIAYKKKIKTRPHLILTLAVIEISLLTPGYFPWFFIYISQFFETGRFETDAFLWFFSQLVLSVFILIALYRFVIKKYFFSGNLLSPHIPDKEHAERSAPDTRQK